MLKYTLNIFTFFILLLLCLNNSALSQNNNNDCGCINDTGDIVLKPGITVAPSGFCWRGEQLVGRVQYVGKCKQQRVSSQERQQRKRYIEVGISDFYLEPVYVDTQSIKKLGQNRYRYTTVTNPLQKDRSEEDAVVNCNNPNFITLLKARYYSNGRLFKNELINTTQQAARQNQGVPQYEANTVVCKLASSILNRAKTIKQC